MNLLKKENAATKTTAILENQVSHGTNGVTPSFAILIFNNGQYAAFGADCGINSLESSLIASLMGNLSAQIRIGLGFDADTNRFIKMLKVLPKIDWRLSLSFLKTPTNQRKPRRVIFLM